MAKKDTRKRESLTTEKREEVTRRGFLAGGAALTVAASGLVGRELIAQTGGTATATQTIDQGPIPDSKEKIVEKGVWMVKESGALRHLKIAEGASLAAPAGKSLTMTVNGVGTAAKPGSYRGNIFLTVSDQLILPGSGLMHGSKPRVYRPAIFIEDGKYVAEKSIPAAARGGKVSSDKAEGVTIYSCEESFNGIIVLGNSRYTIENARIELEGAGHNDFTGDGAGIYCGGNSRVTVNNSALKMKGVTRCTVHACGNSTVTFNNCRLANESPATDYMFPTWTHGFKGSNRVTQHCDCATSYYNNCHIVGNGWGALSHDGGAVVRMYVKDSTIELAGPRSRGYGAFSNGDDSLVSFDHCTVNVQGYPMLLGGTSIKACGEITGGTVINSPLYGVMIFETLSSELKVKDSTLNTASSTFVVKGSTETSLTIDGAIMNPGNGVILQLMDSELPEESNTTEFLVPIGLTDEPIPGRDLTVANPKEDVLMTVANAEVTGDFYNSTTNLKANCNPKAAKLEAGKVPGMPQEVKDAWPAPSETAGSSSAVPWKDRQGPKNLDLKFVKTTVRGVISAATAAYGEGVTAIGPENCEEMSAITQSAHEAVNNGVIVSFDKDSVWVVTGTSHLTSLTIDAGAIVLAPEGKTLTMTVNGAKTKTAPGSYKGKIVVAVA